LPVAGSTWTTGLSAPGGLVDNDLRRKALLSASRQTAKAIRQKEEAEEEEKEEEEARQVEKP